MNHTRYLVASEPYGTDVNNNFDDTPPAEVLLDAVVNKIVVGQTSGFVTGIEVHYATGNPSAVRHGLSYSDTTFTLAASEYVTMIEGSLLSDKICRLTLITNKRILGTVGVPSKDQKLFVWSVADKVPSHLAHRMGLLCFAGSVERSELRSLQPKFADYPCEEVNAKYESVSTPPSHIQLNVSSPARSPALLSTFALRLMAPSVTLYAGSERTEFHASEETLCELAFFKACLKGQFKEATEKTIQMPDDDADTVAAMIEFLYTGSYTYAYDSEIAGLRAGSAGGILDVPISDIRQALFHLSVYTIGAKYDFQSLACAAAQNLRVVTREVDAIGFLQVCEAMYQHGLHISDLRKTEEPVVFKGRITEWVTSLCAKHRDELVKATAKYPDLACDLLDFATRGSEQ